MSRQAIEADERAVANRVDHTEVCAGWKVHVNRFLRIAIMLRMV
jgi:hypothetical protein